ncbi:MAG: hypothetical protein WBQ30_03175 [Thermoanaerobaculia bacterium]
MAGNENRTRESDLSETEMGAPIRELADLRVSPDSGFVGRIRSSIDRRRLGSELTDLGWNGVLAVMVQFLDFAIQIITGSETENKRR